MSTGQPTKAHTNHVLPIGAGRVSTEQIHLLRTLVVGVHFSSSLAYLGAYRYRPMPRFLNEDVRHGNIPPKDQVAFVGLAINAT